MLFRNDLAGLEEMMKFNSFQSKFLLVRTAKKDHESLSW